MVFIYQFVILLFSITTPETYINAVFIACFT